MQTALPAHVPWPTRTTLLVVSMLTVMAGAIVAPSLPQIADAFGEPADKPILAKLVLSLPALAIVLFAPLSGWITDRFGRRKLLLLGLFVYMLAGSSGLYLHSPAWVLAGRFLLGVAMAMIMTTSTTLISDLFTGPERGRFLGFQAACMALGGVLFLPLGGVLAEYGDWHWPFALYALAWPMALAAWAYIPEPNRSATNPHPAHATSPLAPTSIRWSRILAIYSVAFVTMVTMYLMPTQLPFYLKDAFQGGPLIAGLAVATSSAASALVGLLFGRFSRWASPVSLMAACLTLMGLGFAILGQINERVYLWPVLVLAGLGGGLMVPTLSNWLLKVAPVTARGRLSGGLISCIFLGQFLSPILMKPLTDQHGIATTFVVIGLLLVVLGLGYAVAGLLTRQRSDHLASTVRKASSPAVSSKTAVANSAA